ncbi:hypothetical protein AB4305_09715 [Nocardia sp. 2YAB30]|uniref:hypothetical protein n=1 Tax=unclassified Nocardia TaxID=2637762 RepID=UPI003F9622F2
MLDHYNSGARRVLALYSSGSDETSDNPNWSSDEIRAALLVPAAQYRERQKQAYLFDTLVLESHSVHNVQDNRATRNELARDLGKNDFFEASCAIRAIEPRGVERLAHDLLDETRDTYLEAMRSILGGTVEEGRLSEVYSNLLTENSDQYPVHRIAEDLETEVRRLGIQDSVRIVRSSRSKISTNITIISPRSATIFLAEYGGLESYRAAFHALGHALYAVQTDILEEDLLGVNIAATEVCAFAAQEIALKSVAPESRALLDIMPTYYARLYALRLIDEYRFYRSGPDDVMSRHEYAARLGIIPESDFRPGRRLSAVDFVIGFFAYLQRERTTNMEEVRAAATSNWHHLTAFGCLTPDVEDISTG